MGKEYSAGISWLQRVNAKAWFQNEGFITVMTITFTLSRFLLEIMTGRIDIAVISLAPRLPNKDVPLTANKGRMRSWLAQPRQKSGDSQLARYREGKGEFT